MKMDPIFGFTQQADLRAYGFQLQALTLHPCSLLLNIVLQNSDSDSDEDEEVEPQQWKAGPVTHSHFKESCGSPLWHQVYSLDTDRSDSSEYARCHSGELRGAVAE